MHAVANAMGYIKLLSLFTDMTEGIKQWKRHALSTKNYLIMKKVKYVGPVVFAVSPWPELCIRRVEGWTAGQISNALVADRLLAAEVINNDSAGTCT